LTPKVLPMTSRLKTRQGQRQLLYHCPTCNRRFKNQLQRERHLLVHGPQRPFGCLLCDYAATKMAALSAHVRKHLFLYVCSFCGEPCVSSQRLRAHLKERHPEAEPEQAFAECIEGSYCLIPSGDEAWWVGPDGERRGGGPAGGEGREERGEQPEGGGEGGADPPIAEMEAGGDGGQERSEVAVEVEVEVEAEEAARVEDGEAVTGEERRSLAPDDRRGTAAEGQMVSDVEKENISPAEEGYEDTPPAPTPHATETPPTHGSHGNGNGNAPGNPEETEPEGADERTAASSSSSSDPSDPPLAQNAQPATPEDTPDLESSQKALSPGDAHDNGLKEGPEPRTEMVRIIIIIIIAFLIIFVIAEIKNGIFIYAHLKVAFQPNLTHTLHLYYNNRRVVLLRHCIIFLYFFYIFRIF